MVKKAKSMIAKSVTRSKNPIYSQKKQRLTRKRNLNRVGNLVYPNRAAYLRGEHGI
jgi:hypothetical protein